MSIPNPPASTPTATPPAPPTPETMETVLKALADRNRLRILALLQGGEVCVCHLHESLGLPQPTVSRHLAYLRRAGLVDTRKDGLWVHYRLRRQDDPVLATMVETASHGATHLSTAPIDRKRLEQLTGACRPNDCEEGTSFPCCS